MVVVFVVVMRQKDQNLKSYFSHINWELLFKADMKSYKSLETAAIFYSSEPFLKQGIS